MPINPQIHRSRLFRDSIRLKGYYYSQAGTYFITICCQDRKCLFGKIINSEMILNDAGIMIGKWCQKIPEKFADIEMDVFQIMPNHFHAIIINNGNGVGANPYVRPNNNTNISGKPILGEHMGSLLHRVVQWFKTMSTNEYIRGVKITRGSLGTHFITNNEYLLHETAH